MRRRDFIKSIVFAATAGPLAARAQQSAKLRTIGFSGQSTRSAESDWDYAFTQRLREFGWIEGRTIAIEYRWAEGSRERAAEIAAEFVRLNVDVIVTSGTPEVLAAKPPSAFVKFMAAPENRPVCKEGGFEPPTSLNSN